MTVSAIGSSARNRTVSGVALLLLGLGVDGVAGVVVVSAADPRAYLVHIPAVLGYALGMSLLDDEGAGGERRSPNAGRSADRRPCPRPTRWSLTATLLGLALFPGLGLLGCSIAFAVSRLGGRSEYASSSVKRPAATAVSTATLKAVDPLVELQFEPLVDALRDANVPLKRSAIAMVTHGSTERAVRVLRPLLSDPDRAVRQDAGVALSRIEQSLDRSMASATKRIQERPDAERYAELARLCAQYATSGLPDDASRSRHFEQARQALDTAVELDPARVDLWLELARVQVRLGQPAEAFLALDRAISGASADASTYLIGMEAAFAAGRWERLVEYARAGRGAPTDELATAELVAWWADGPPAGWTAQR